MSNPASTVDHLNRDCHCISVEREQLESALVGSLDPELAQAVRETQQTLFADSPVFVSGSQVAAMRAIIAAVEQAVACAGYRQAAFARAPAIARHSPGPAGVFFGFDFHLAADSPQLIEINTNAGAALLSLHLARAQRACCQPVADLTVGTLEVDLVERAMIDMFRDEWRASGIGRELATIAIVDQSPRQQFLAPELEMFRRAFEAHGLGALVADPRELEMRDGRLWHGQRLVDLVYNRLTDFYLEDAENAALREAYVSSAITLTPHPHVYALYADKRNLAALSDEQRLIDWGLEPAIVATLVRGVPATRRVTAKDGDELWAQRRQLFFKPATGYGSRGSYDGAKLTRKTFARILEGDYVAQKRVAPSLRRLVVDGEEKELKVDIRCFVYRGQIQLLTARLYRGQTTNFRTTGGGLATVFTTPESFAG